MQCLCKKLPFFQWYILIRMWQVSGPPSYWMSTMTILKVCPKLYRTHWEWSKRLNLCQVHRSFRFCVQVALGPTISATSYCRFRRSVMTKSKVLVIQSIWFDNLWPFDALLNTFRRFFAFEIMWHLEKFQRHQTVWWLSRVLRVDEKNWTLEPSKVSPSCTGGSSHHNFDSWKKK